MRKRIAIIGGGAAGFFCAVNLARKNPDYSVTIYEKSSKLLSKVKVSGGGRCNVTHACFDPEKLIKFYPRGENELFSPFQQFNPKNTISWFEERGVKLKTENDGRVFPVTDNSQTIIDCFLREAEKYNVQIKTGMPLTGLQKNSKWQLTFIQNIHEEFDAVMLAAGSSESTWNLLKKLNYTIIPPVPSLFTFHINDKRIKELMGLSVPHATAHLSGREIKTNGPLLITHWGMSGPAILKLSSHEAIYLHSKNYQAEIIINYAGQPKSEIRERLKILRDSEAKKLTGTNSQFGLPVRLWRSLTDYLKLSDRKWAGLGNKDLDNLATELCEGKYKITGKSTFKEEFVTCGGVSLGGVNMLTMESKIHTSLFFGGEVLNIDAVTGGFNFQAAWTAGWIASENI